MHRNLGFCLLLLLPFQAGEEAASARERISAQAREVHRRGRYPESLSIRDAKPNPSLATDFQPSSGSAFDFTLVAYLLAGLAGALLVLTVLSRGLNSGRGRVPGGVVQATAPAPAADLEDPEELVRAGRYAEAIGALLLAGLRLTGWNPLQESGLTGREVVGRLRREEGRRGPLQELLRLAEAVRFGGVPATAEHVRQARRALEAAGGAS